MLPLGHESALANIASMCVLLVVFMIVYHYRTSDNLLMSKAKFRNYVRHLHLQIEQCKHSACAIFMMSRIQNGTSCLRRKSEHV